MPIQSIDHYRCMKCAICAKVCIADVIRIQGGKPEIMYPEDCVGCLLCEMECPGYAIRVTNNYQVSS